MVKKIDILYLFGHSSRMANQLARLIPIIKAQVSKGITVGVVLIHNAVIGTTLKGNIPPEIKALTVSNNSLTLFMMIPDLNARGISNEDVIQKINLIDYDELVNLMDQATKIISWM